MINVANAVAKWVRNTGGASESMKLGVLSVTDSPCAKAAQQADRYVAGVQAAVASGKWQNALNGITLQSWQQSMITKGIPRMAQGVAAAQPKVQAFLQQFLPFVDQAAQEVRNMPKGGVENGVARASAMIRKLAQFKKS